jgi:hypothetical protein
MGHDVKAAVDEAGDVEEAVWVRAGGVGVRDRQKTFFLGVRKISRRAPPMMPLMPEISPCRGEMGGEGGVR